MPYVPFCRFIILGLACPWGDRCRFYHEVTGCNCGLSIKNEHLQGHLRGKRHRFLLAELQARLEGQANGTTPIAPGTQTRNNAQENTRRCRICRRFVLLSLFDVHTQNHEQQRRMQELRERMEEDEKDKGGIEVGRQEGVDFAVVGADLFIEVEVEVKNVSERAVALQSCKISGRSRASENCFTARLVKKSRRILPNITRKIKVGFKASEAGRYEDILELVFVDLSTRVGFVITRKVSATVTTGDPREYERLKPEEPYIRTREPLINLSGKVITGTRPPEWTKTSWAERLPHYDVPQFVIDAAFGINERNAVQNIRRLMPEQFTAETYGKWFQYLLYVEEEQLRQDLMAYALSGAELEADYPRYSLEVKGLAEGRPSILVGDYIRVSREGEGQDGQERTWYEGRVQRVLLDSISIRLPEGFSTYRGSKFDVQFVFNRISYRRMYHILNNGMNAKRLLFPAAEHIKASGRVTVQQKLGLSLTNRLLEGDDEQLETIAAILNLPPGSPPFIVFGPPGTGKTVTIVEAMQQILMSNPNARILACAPNNSAADLITEKLMNLGTSVVFRLNSITRNREELPKTIEKFCLINDNSIFAIPHAGTLAKYRVVVSTCLSGGVPSSLGLKPGHFSHIFIDEAGQGKEPEVMVPIKSIAGKDTNVILAGDNQQLGPIVHSKTANLLGLKNSYLSRLMGLDIYDIDKERDARSPGGRGLTIVKLIKNFRSHPSILHFPNERFYNSELQSCGDAVMVRSLENAEDLPKRGFPMVFHGIIGKDEQEKRSPSFFNVDEAIVVKKYCESLISNRKNGIRPEHIGIITPYYAQRCKIKSLLDRDVKLRGITVGSVEQFQGQERRIIIISTVRSNENYLTSDMRRSLGFVADQRRFNVAITRAQALLLVIGNPILLSLDPLWRAFMNYIYLRGGWKGKKIEWDPIVPVEEGMGATYDQERKTQIRRENEDMITRLKALIVKKYEDEDLDLDQIGITDGEDEDGLAGAAERPIIREYE